MSEVATHPCGRCLSPRPGRWSKCPHCGHEWANTWLMSVLGAMMLVPTVLFPLVFKGGGILMSPPEGLRVVESRVELSTFGEHPRVVVTGWVENTTDRALTYIALNVTLLDAEGRLVDSLGGVPIMSSLSPGERTPFRTVQRCESSQPYWSMALFQVTKCGPDEYERHGPVHEPIAGEQQLRFREVDGVPVEAIVVGTVLETEGTSGNLSLHVTFHDEQGQLVDLAHADDGWYERATDIGYRARAELLWPPERYAEARLIAQRLH
ncbi:MAG: FxLYD domain-containing protein [Acidobacteriota bacterium]